MDKNYTITNLKKLEAESIEIIREVVAEFENPVMLYSIGKDSSVMLRLAQKAFYPAPITFPLLHVDTSYKFPEMIKFRDEYCKKLKIDLKIYQYPDIEKNNINPFDLGTVKCCSLLKTKALLNALKEKGYDAAFGGARRDEEKSRAKERVFSFRDKNGQWDPKQQRPELWNIFNAKINPEESIRVFPISNWTELDIWQYISLEEIPIVPLYFAKEYEVIKRNGQLIPVGQMTRFNDGETPEKIMCRFRTLGCYPCTGAVPSSATSIEEIIEEMMLTRQSERITRIIDHDQDGSMEQKKQEGYF